MASPTSAETAARAPVGYVCVDNQHGVNDYLATAAMIQAIELAGIIRDFHRSHPDFEAVPAGGYGHYAGNLQPWLPGTKRPVYTGTGYRVDGEELPGVIDQPCLTIFGTAIPNHYYEALSERMLTNGFFARTITRFEI